MWFFFSIVFLMAAKTKMNLVPGIPKQQHLFPYYIKEGELLWARPAWLWSRRTRLFCTLLMTSRSGTLKKITSYILAERICLNALLRAHTHTHTHTHMLIYIYIYAVSWRKSETSYKEVVTAGATGWYATSLLKRMLFTLNTNKLIKKKSTWKRILFSSVLYFILFYFWQFWTSDVGFISLLRCPVQLGLSIFLLIRFSLVNVIILMNTFSHSIHWRVCFFSKFYDFFIS